MGNTGQRTNTAQETNTAQACYSQRYGRTARPGRGPGFLSEEHSGLPWMLDPSSPDLIRHLRHQAAGPDAPANYEDFVQDAGELRELLAQRHIALVLDPEKKRRTDAAVDRWVNYLQQNRPTTLAGCAGSLGRDLALTLQDGHLYVRHGVGAHANKARRGADPGPAWSSWTSNGTRIVRIRSLDGSGGAEQELLAGAAKGAKDLSRRNILVDLRGNGGGDDSYVQSWIAWHTQQPVPACRERAMTLKDGTPIILWNHLTWLTLSGRAAPDALRQRLAPPAADDDEMTISDSGAAGLPGDGPSESNWEGRMIVVIDGGTGSSGESAALMLRAAFGAVLVGAPSCGIIDYGNAGPYFLPASGLQIHLPSQANEWETAVDFCGIQPDVPVSVHATADALAADFDALYAAGKLQQARQPEPPERAARS